MFKQHRGGAIGLARARLGTGVVAGVLALAAPAGAQAANGGVDQGSSSAAQPDSFATGDHTSDHASAATFDAFRAKAQKQGDVRVIVAVQTRFTPEGTLHADRAASQRT